MWQHHKSHNIQAFPLTYRGRFPQKVEVFSLLLKQFRVCLDFGGELGFFPQFGFFLHSPSQVSSSCDHRWDTWRATNPSCTMGTLPNPTGPPGHGAVGKVPQASCATPGVSPAQPEEGGVPGRVLPAAAAPTNPAFPRSLLFTATRSVGWHWESPSGLSSDDLPFQGGRASHEASTGPAAVHKPAFQGSSRSFCSAAAG